MKNHFFIPYAGNKRNECENLYDEVKDKLDNIEFIIEPFCGTSAFSYYLSLKHPKKFTYILNDNNKNLIELYKIVADEAKFKKFIEDVNIILIDIDKIKYNALNKNELIGWFIHNKIYAIRAGLFPSDIYKINKNINNIINCPIINFLRTEHIILENKDGIKIVEKYIDDERCLIFLDPPYLISCNQFYSNTDVNIYEYLCNNQIQNQKALFLLCLENNWIIKLLFNTNIKKEYNKLYQTSKKKTTHLIITNF